jgi:DNA-binding protein YbaB
VQQQLLAAQAATDEQVFRGQAGGGVVSVELTGGLDVRACGSAPRWSTPADVEMLEDLVLAAVRDAVAPGDGRPAGLDG